MCIIGPNTITHNASSEYQTLCGAPGGCSPKQCLNKCPKHYGSPGSDDGLPTHVLIGHPQSSFCLLRQRCSRGSSQLGCPPCPCLEVYIFWCPHHHSRPTLILPITPLVLMSVLLTTLSTYPDTTCLPDHLIICRYSTWGHGASRLECISLENTCDCKT